MARLASNAKMGFYPTPDKTLRLLRKWLNFDERSKVLDPCCGPGTALKLLTGGNSDVVTYGVELDSTRAAQAENNLTHQALGSIFDVRINPLASIGLLYLNPPYDTENGERVEMEFLKHAAKWLAHDGVLVFLVPEHIFSIDKYRAWISRHFKDVCIIRAHRDDYPDFRQAVLFARKALDTGMRRLSEFPNPPYKYIEDVPAHPYSVHFTTGPEVFQGTDAVTEDDIISYNPIVLKQIEQIAGPIKRAANVRPLLPLRKGHLISLVTAGIIDGELNTADGPMIIKGFHERKEEVREEEEVEITKMTFNVGIRVMEVANGVWYDIK